MAEKCNKCGGWISLEFISVTNDTQWCKCNKGSWTTDTPTEPGWYWWKTAPDTEPIVVGIELIKGQGFEYLGVYIPRLEGDKANKVSGEWSERIEPPE